MQMIEHYLLCKDLTNLIVRRKRHLEILMWHLTISPMDWLHVGGGGHSFKGLLPSMRKSGSEHTSGNHRDLAWDVALLPHSKLGKLFSFFQSPHCKTGIVLVIMSWGCSGSDSRTKVPGTAVGARDPAMIKMNMAALRKFPFYWEERHAIKEINKLTVWYQKVVSIDKP